MDKLFIIIKREFMERVRNKVFIIMTLLMPALMAAVILVPAYLAIRSSKSSEVTRTIILDATGTGLGERILANINLDTASTPVSDSVAPRRPDLRIVPASELAAAEAKATGEVQKPHGYAGYLVLTDSTLITGDARYAGRNASSIPDMNRLESALRQSVMMVRLGREGVRPEVIKDLSKIRVDISADRIGDKGKEGSAGAAIGVGFFLAIILYMSIMIHGQNVLRGVQEEKSTRVAEVVLSSVKPDTLLAGKVLGIGAVGLVQQIAWFGLSTAAIAYLMPFVTHGMMQAAGGTTKLAAAGATAGAAAANPAMQAVGLLTMPLIVTVIGFFLSGFIFYAALFAAASSMVNSDQEAMQTAMPIMLPLILTIAMLNPIIMAPNGGMAVALSWLPFSSPIVMPMRMVLGSVSGMQVGAAWLASAFSSALAVWVAARIYRVGMLMYGKKPGMKELVKWIRYA